MSDGEQARLSGRTAWARNLETPLRTFLRTETGSALVLLSATVAALVWVNVDHSSYDRLWQATLSIRVGGSGISEPVRYWLNAGLMTFFFFVVGLEARREFDMGELRERRRLALPLAAGLGGMAVPVVIYLAANAGRPSAHGFGVAMSTDTAFALGMLVLVGPRFPDRLRAFMLTVVVVDDIVALIVIATVYPEHLRAAPLLISLGLLGGCAAAARGGFRSGLFYAALGVGGMGRDDEVRGRPGRGRARDGAPHLRLAGRARRSRACQRPLQALPRAADARARAHRHDRPASRRSPPTSASSSSTTRGRATRSCRCSRSPTWASRSTGASSRVPTARR